MENSGSVQFLYGTPPGRCILKVIQVGRLDRIAVWFLKSPLSRPVIPGYIRRNQIPMEQFREERYRTFRDFFVREKKSLAVDPDPSHLISPCDGWLSTCPIDAHSCFAIKGSHYGLGDLLQDPELARDFHGGTCLIFRLCASDYHHYCYIDDGTLERSQYIEGELLSVQPVACAAYPVYTPNRRVWSLLQTAHFGPVIQTEIGALVVGGIVNRPAPNGFHRGEEKGRFELSGSTITLLLQKDRAALLPQLAQQLTDGREVRVTYGMQIGTRLPQEPQH